MERKEGDMNPKWLLFVADRSVDTDEVDTRPGDDIETCEALLKDIISECLSASQDAHNTVFTSTNTQPKSMHVVTTSWKAYAEFQTIT